VPCDAVSPSSQMLSYKKTYLGNRQERLVFLRRGGCGRDQGVGRGGGGLQVKESWEAVTTSDQISEH